MAKPEVKIRITDKDATGPGWKSALAKADKAGQHAKKAAHEGGFLGKTLKGLGKLGKMEFGFESLTRIGEMSKAANENVSGLTRGVFNLGIKAPAALGAVAEGAGLVAGATAAALTALVGLGAATEMLGEKWAKSGADIARATRTMGVGTDWFQATRAGAERFGVTADQTESSVDAFASTLHKAKYGANNLALGALTQLGVKLKYTKDGALDTASAFDDVTDAIARQKDPQTQKEIAEVFGLGGMLPALRQGSKSLRAEGADYLGSGAAMSPEQISQAEGVERRTVRFHQTLGSLEKKAGMAALGAAGSIADRGDELLRDPGAAGRHAMDDAKSLVGDLGHAGGVAARELVQGGRDAGRAIGDEFLKFRDRIEHQESRGRQFGRNGRPLISNRGAVGAMQVLPETGKRAAARAGVAWDEDRFYNDKAYNEQIGTAELWTMFQKYRGDEVLAAAAYNAGPGRADRWVKKFGDPRKGQISDADFASKIPFAETKDYVGKTAQPQARVIVDFKNAPPGTSVRASGGPGVDVAVSVAHALDGNP